MFIYISNVRYEIYIHTHIVKMKVIISCSFWFLFLD